MIQIQNFQLSFKNFSISIPNLSLPNKGAYILDGANGSGKSSIFKTLMQQYSHYNGSVTLNSLPINSYSSQDISKLIAYVPQISTSLPRILGEDFVKQGLYLGGENNLKNLIQHFNIQDLLLKNCFFMSGGEKQLCTIVRNLAIPKKITILDEADSFLSKKNKTLLVDLVSNISDSNLVLISSHQQELYPWALHCQIEEIDDNCYYLNF